MEDKIGTNSEGAVMTDKLKKNNESIKKKRTGKWRAFVPYNLDMSQFGDNADKISLILDWVYRAKMYKNNYGYADQRRKFTERVGLYTKRIVEMLHEPAAPLLDVPLPGSASSDFFSFCRYCSVWLRTCKTRAAFLSIRQQSRQFRRRSRRFFPTIR